MSQNSAALLLLAACLWGLAIFAIIHRRDAFGALAALVMAFGAVVVALVGFAASASPAGAAQLQAFAVLVELMASLFIAVGVALTTVLWRRTGADLLSQVALPAPSAQEDGGSSGELEPEVAQEEGAQDSDSVAVDQDEAGLDPDQEEADGGGKAPSQES